MLSFHLKPNQTTTATGKAHFCELTLPHPSSICSPLLTPHTHHTAMLLVYYLSGPELSQQSINLELISPTSNQHQHHKQQQRYKDQQQQQLHTYQGLLNTGSFTKLFPVLNSPQKINNTDNYSSKSLLDQCCSKLCQIESNDTKTEISTPIACYQCDTDPGNKSHAMQVTLFFPPHLQAIITITLTSMNYNKNKAIKSVL